LFLLCRCARRRAGPGEGRAGAPTSTRREGAAKPERPARSLPAWQGRRPATGHESVVEPFLLSPTSRPVPGSRCGAPRRSAAHRYAGTPRRRARRRQWSPRSSNRSTCSRNWPQRGAPLPAPDQHLRVSLVAPRRHEPLGRLSGTCGDYELLVDGDLTGPVRGRCSICKPFASPSAIRFISSGPSVNL
jgi:hypothetical protein